MSTTQQQTSQFSPQGMSTYQSLQPGLAQTLGWYLGGGGAGGPASSAGATSGPFASPLFRAGLGQGTMQAEQQGQTALSNIGMNASQFGGGQVPGFLQSQARQAGYQTSGLQQNAYWNALNSTVSSQLGAASTAAGFKPLQTGSTQKTSGLGTWLPQVVAAGLSAATGGLTGGLSGMAGMAGPSLGGSSSGFINAMNTGLAGTAGAAPSFGIGAAGSIPGLGATLGDMPSLSGY